MTVLFVIAPKNFRDEEYIEPLDVLEDAGIETKTSSRETTIAYGTNGAAVEVDLDISEAKAEDYDAILLIGGSGAKVYFDDVAAHQLIQRMNELKKILCAICIAPSTLANAGILKGKNAAVFPSEINNLKAKGANVQDESVVVDGNIVTASGPEVATEFGEAVLKLLQT